MVLIDTSAWIFALGPRPILAIRQRVQSLIKDNQAAVTSPILFELLSGARSQEDYLSLTVNLLSLHPFPLAPDEWIEAAAWTKKLRLRGLSIKTIDALVAFKAVKHKLILLHADEDFDRLAKHFKFPMESYTHHVRATRSR